MSLAKIQIMAVIVQANPRMLDTLKRQEGFPDIERQVAALIGNAQSTADAIATYNALGHLVPEWKFVFASNSGAMPGFAVHREFSDGSVVRGLLPSENVVVLDPDINRAMLTGGTATFPFDYSIALDTQALSYLAPFLGGKTAALAKDFHEVFTFIARDDVFVDPIPYRLENLSNVLQEANLPEIRRRLGAYEILRTIDGQHFATTSEVRSTLSQEERNTKVEAYISGMIEDACDPSTIAMVRFRQSLCYCILLKMAAIQLGNKQKNKTDKIAELIEFMAARLGTLWAREIVIAAEYFDRGQNLRFFGKVQKGPADQLPALLAQLNNMAWDFWHIRYLETAATNEHTVPEDAGAQPRYFFPALLTCDKRFIEIIDLYPLKSYAYQQGSGQLLPFPARDWTAIAAGSPENEIRWRNRYFSPTAVQERNRQADAVPDQLPAIIRELEAELSKCAVTK